jgi:hypothetical protein
VESDSKRVVVDAERVAIAPTRMVVDANRAAIDSMRVVVVDGVWNGTVFLGPRIGGATPRSSSGKNRGRSYNAGRCIGGRRDPNAFVTQSRAAACAGSAT